MTIIGSYYMGKVELAENSKYIMLEKQDFDQCNFHNLWDQCLDKNRYGTRIKFPFKSAPEFVIVTKTYCC